MGPQRRRHPLRAEPVLCPSGSLYCPLQPPSSKPQSATGTHSLSVHNKPTASKYTAYCYTTRNFSGTLRIVYCGPLRAAVAGFVFIRIYGLYPRLQPFCGFCGDCKEDSLVCIGISS